MTDAALLALIQANPTALAQANAGNDSGVAATIAATLPPVVQPLDQNHLITWAASRALLVVFQQGTTNSNPTIASACIAVQSFLNGGAQTLDLTNPTILGMLSGLTTGGILPTNTDTTGTNPTPGSGADLLLYASVPATVDVAQVSRCLIPLRTGG